MDYLATASNTRGCGRHFDQIALLPHSVPRIVLLDNAAIHNGDTTGKQRRRWVKQGLYLYYLPPYKSHRDSVEAREVLLAHVAAVNGAELLGEIQFLMSGFGSKFTVYFV